MSRSLRGRLEQLERRQLERAQAPGQVLIAQLAELFRRIDAYRDGTTPDPEMAELLQRIDAQEGGELPSSEESNGRRARLAVG